MTIREVSAVQAHAIPYRFRATKLGSVRLPGNIAVPPQVLGLVVLDALLLAIAIGVALWGSSQPRFLPDAADVDSDVRPWAVVLTLGWLAALGISGAYQTRFLGARMLEYRRVLNASVVVPGPPSSASVPSCSTPWSRGFFGLLFLVGIPLLLLGRLGMRRGLHTARMKGHRMTPTLIAGDEAQIDDLARVLRREGWLGFEIVGALSSAHSGRI